MRDYLPRGFHPIAVVIYFLLATSFKLECFMSLYNPKCHLLTLFSALLPSVKLCIYVFLDIGLCVSSVSQSLYCFVLHHPMDEHHKVALAGKRQIERSKGQSIMGIKTAETELIIEENVLKLINAISGLCHQKQTSNLMFR